MKKISGKIAMILILVMLGSMVIGCYFTQWCHDTGGAALLLIIPCIVIDIIVDFFAFWVWIFNNGGKINNVDDEIPLTEEEYAILAGKTAYMPEED